MKNLILLIPILILIFIFSCKKQDTPVNPTFENISGVWQLKDFTKNNVTYFYKGDYANNYMMFYSTYYYSGRIGNSSDAAYIQGIFDIEGNNLDFSIFNSQSSSNSKFKLKVEELNDTQITLKDTSTENGTNYTWRFIYKKVPNPTTYRVSNKTYATLTFASFCDEGSGIKDFCYHGSIIGKKSSTDAVFTTRNRIFLGIITPDLYYFTVHPQSLSAGKENEIILADTTTVISTERNANISNLSLKSLSIKKTTTVREALLKNPL